MSPKRRLRAQVCVGILGLAVSALTVAVVLSGTPPEDRQALIAAGHLLTFAVPFAIGMWLWHWRPESKVGPLLIVTSFAWAPTALAESDSSFLYSVGRCSLWLVEPLILYLILAFPSGRLVTRIDKALVAATAAIAAVLFVPTAFLVESYPLNTPLSSCQPDCPPNFFMLLDSTPGFIDPVRTVREILIAAVFLAGAARLFTRLRHATVLMRRTMTPVLIAAIARCGAYAAFLPARRLAPDAPAVDVLGWVLILTLPAIALGVLIGLVRWRLHVADAMETLARKVLSDPDLPNLRTAVAEALEDPALEIAHWNPGKPGRWVSTDGTTLDIEHPAPGRVTTEIAPNGHPALVLVHDPALCEHEDFLHAAGSMVLFATENESLTMRLRDSMRDLEESRARIMVAADSERRRIERDLHDGAQQRLVALRIKLELADDLMDRDSEHAHKLVHEVEEEVEEALDDVRSLARGVYPALLADQGLKEALRSAAVRAAVPTRVHCDGVERYPAEVEAAVYFTCLEALQNIAKHAHGATTADIDLTAGPPLRFEVRDNGAGFDPARNGWGLGLTNMRDRLSAVGGIVVVRSSPGRGTVISGTIPAARPPA